MYINSYKKEFETLIQRMLYQEMKRFMKSHISKCFIYEVMHVSNSCTCLNCNDFFKIT